MKKELLQRVYDNLTDECLKKEIKAEYPTLFQDRGYFNFGPEYLLDTTRTDGGPLVIGYGLAPRVSLEHRCLLVASDYELETMWHDGRKVLLFKKNN